MSVLRRWRARYQMLTFLLSMLLVASVMPAAAWDGEADDLPEYSACVGPALDSAGFRDVAGYSRETRDAVNCLAHYRITLGMSSLLYAPRVEVTRRQMALFLIRAARPAGIYVPDPTDQGFMDIADLPRQSRDAINQLAEIGITDGKTARTYAPEGVVTRQQMAKFLARFLELAQVGVGGVDIEDVSPDDELFEDIDNLPRSIYRAITELYELGVVQGTSEPRFSPSQPVTRAQMALFITRALAHTNARPAGITLQPGDSTVFAESSTEIVVSVRDRHQRPVVDGSVDLFHASASEDPFDNNGRCEEDEVTPEFGDEPCEIDRGDEITDSDGNLLYDLQIDYDLVLYAWTGDLDDRFDVDRTDYVSVEYNAVKPAVAFELTDDMHPAAEKAPFGRRVDFTFQLVDEDGDPVAQEDVELTVISEERTDERVIRIRTRDHRTDESGRVELYFRIERPRASADDITGYLDLDVDHSDGLDVIDETAVGILDTNTELEWSAEDDVPTSLVLEQTVAYHTASASGSGARNTVRATLVDQYGDPVRGEKIHFFSNDSLGLFRDPNDSTMAQSRYRPNTNRSGQATVRYTRDSINAGTEEIWAVSEDDGIESARVNHYWVVRAPARNLVDFTVLIHNEDRDILVIGRTGEGPYVIAYDDDDDRFNEDTQAESYDSFARNLEEGDTIDVNVQGHDRDYINVFTRYPVSG